jgi:hypothetical protein
LCLAVDGLKPAGWRKRSPFDDGVFSVPWRRAEDIG